MSRENEQEFLNTVLKGNQSAAMFCQMLFRMSQTIDDLVDGDKPVTISQIYDAFWTAIVDLPMNEFYRQFESELRPMVAMALQDFIDSVALERSEEHRHKVIAFTLRDQLTGIVIHCARFTGGYAWMREVSAAIRDHFHEDELDDYIQSIVKPVQGEEAV